MSLSSDSRGTLQYGLVVHDGLAVSLCLRSIGRRSSANGGGSFFGVAWDQHHPPSPGHEDGLLGVVADGPAEEGRMVE